MRQFFSIFFVVLFFILFFYFIFNVKVWFVLSLILLIGSLFIDISIISGILFAVVFFGIFFYFKLYSSIIFWISGVFLILMTQSEFARHYVFRFISVILGALYFPLNFALMDAASWSKSLRTTDPVIYWMSRVVLFPLLLFVTVFSIPFEWILDRAH
jgi:hypothetical protein